MDRGFGTPGGPKFEDFRPGNLKQNKYEKFLKFFFSGKIGPSGNHAKIIFRWSGSNISEVSQVCFFGNDPRKIMKT